MNIAPGFYPDLSIEDYHASNGISKSGLSHIAKSPRHYWDRYLNPDRVEKAKSDELIMGSLVHTLILEPNLYDEQYCVLPDCDRRTKEGKEVYNKNLKESNGKTVISKGMLEIAQGMRDSLMKESEASSLIEGGQVEASIYFKDVDHGVLCKSRPDILFDGYIVDLKTTRDASHDSFSRDVYNYSYHIQAALMQEAIFVTFGKMIKDFFFICIEKEPPYATAVYLLEDEAIHKGRDEYKKLLKIYKECLESGKWEGYGVRKIGLPRWVR